MMRYATMTALALVTSPSFGDRVDFNRDVRPILADHCYECHGPDEESREADLRLDQLDDAIGWVIEPGDVADSTLVDRIVSSHPDDMMPPPHSKRRPSDQQIATLRRWIQQGAPHETHWAFVPPRPSPIPAVDNSDWPRNPIDHFVASHLRSESLSPRPEAAPRVFARRLSLALTGLPILPNEADAFAAAYERNDERAIVDLVDRQLASHAYGEHRAWLWMDAARYADTNGYQGDAYRLMWPWRDWLVRNLNRNTPLDRMTELMLAGDLLLPDAYQEFESADWIADRQASDQLVATGFLRNHRYDTGSGTIPAESKFENAADRMETVGTVWMGMTMLCARCHTHKYDPIKNHEYYELLSFFDNVPEVGAALKGASHPYIHVPTPRQREVLLRLRMEVRSADAAMAAADRDFARAQTVWESQFMEPRHPMQIHPLGKSRNPGESPGPANDRVTRGLKHRFAIPAIEFDGETSIKKSNEPVALCAGNRPWTISFWFRPENDRPGAIFSSVEEPERYRPGIQADWTGDKIRLRHVCRWVNSYIEFESTGPLEIGRWHHVAFRCDGRMQGLAYSASLHGNDDAMVCTHAVTNDSAGKAGKAPLVLGDSPLMPGFHGSLRDLRFYDREVSDDEVTSLANPRPTMEIVEIPFERRTTEERRTLRLAFLDHLRSNSDDECELARLYQRTLDAHARLTAAISRTPTCMVMQESTTEVTRIRLAGVYDSLGAEVDSNVPDMFPRLKSESRDRLGLARWLMHPDHPLTARVAVNRVWQSLWGRGFVDSPENFGTQTAAPIHGELLDWLATEYVRTGWDTKALIRLIVTSRTYRQRSDADEEAWHRDPGNRHLARGPRYRLPVHTLRDQALHLSAGLENIVGGPPVVLEEVRGKDGRVVDLPFEKSTRRRTLYTFWKRNSPHPMLAVFDVADRNQCEVRAMRTDTPLQALVTLNGPGFAEAAAGLAQRARTHGPTDVESLRWMWKACTGRMPDATTLESLISMLGEYRLMAGGDDEAAWTAVGNVLLNLDMTLTLE